MRIVVNHLTRMYEGRICVAGVDLDTGEHVRPMPFRDTLGVGDLRPAGGWCDMAVEVEVRNPRRKPDPPHVEDVRYDPRDLRFVREWRRAEFWALLRSACTPTLRGIFGEALRPLTGGQHRRYGTDQWQGTASLGCLECPEPPALALEADREGRPRLRLRFTDGEAKADASVTDLRLHLPDHSTPDETKVEKLGRRLETSGGIILSVGLGRPYAGREGTPPLHWLQANNIHLAECPLWRLALSR